MKCLVDLRENHLREERGGERERDRESEFLSPLLSNRKAFIQKGGREGAPQIEH